MRFSAEDTQWLAHLLREVSRAEILPRFRRLSPAAIRAKTSPTDLVTEADIAAETAITRALLARFPAAVVVGEEATSADRSVLARLDEPGLVFVVDPIDGTSNYAAGLPLFGVMVAAIVDGAVIAGVIYDPIGDDAAIARLGEGAWTQAVDGGRTALRVIGPVPISEMTGAVSWRYMPEAARSAVCANLPRFAACFDYRCAAHEYRMLAAGHCHFLVFNRLMPWDHAPGWLLHREAGGFSAQFDGSAYRPGRITGGLIAAADQAGWTLVRRVLFDGVEVMAPPRLAPVP